MIAYDIVNDFYGAKTTKRSKVPLINHIDQGLKILTALGESDVTKSAFCLHPLLQDDVELSANWNTVCSEIKDPVIIMLAMEYRNIANGFLREKMNVFPIDSVKADVIRLSPIPAVNNMLIADKVQNRKDFELYHQKTHPASVQLEKYFKLWLQRLGISEDKYLELCKIASNS